MAIWPTSVSTDADLYVAKNSLQTTLATAVGTGDVSVVLASATGFPVAGAVVIGNEVIFYTNISGATLTGCTRGADGTTAAAHLVGVPVGAAVVAFHHNVLKDEIKAIETYLSANLGTGATPLTASRALASNSSNKIVASSVLDTELAFLSGVTSAIQTQLDAKAVKALSNLAAVAINASLLPASDNAINVGSSTLAYAGVFARSMNGSFVGGLKNKLINGDMVIDQRHEGAATTVSALTASTSVDRWRGTGATTAGVFTLTRTATTPPTGFNYYLRAAVTTNDASPASGASYSVRQDVETFSMQDIYSTSGMTAVTLSFWVRSSVTGTYGVGLVNLDASSIRSYVAQYTINSANTWEYKTIVVPADVSTNSIIYGDYALQVRFDLGSGASREGTANSWTVGAFWRASSNTKLINTNAATWDVTGVQLEAGGVPTTFEYRPFDFELQRCQRYYEKSLKIGIAPGSSDTSNQYVANASQFGATSMEAGNLAFKARKRTVPSVTLYKSDGSNNNWDWLTTAGVSSNRTTTVPEITETAFAIRQTTAVEYLTLGHWVADAE